MTKATDRGAVARPPLVLVAEDAAIVRLDLCRLLVERAGYAEVIEARDGEEAVAVAREHKPDLAVLDVKMPKLDGIEAARQILAERPLPIVMLTAYSDETSVDRAADAGVFAYLVKPFREQDLLPAIRLAEARHLELITLTNAVRAAVGRAGQGAARSARRAVAGRGVRPPARGEQAVGSVARGDR